MTRGAIDETATPSLSSFDVTVAIVPPPDYLGSRIGVHYATQDGQIAVAVEAGAPQLTAMHEIGHYFLNETDPFTGRLTKDKNRNKPPNPPRGSAGERPRTCPRQSRLDKI